MENGGKPFKSKLIPCLERIRNLRKEGASYAEIAVKLKIELGIEAHRATIHSFVKARTKVRKVKYALPDENITPALPASRESVFAALRRAAKAKTQEREIKKSGFIFDENEPIR